MSCSASYKLFGNHVHITAIQPLVLLGFLFEIFNENLR